MGGVPMVEVLNELEIDVACAGNHDFDFGHEKFLELSKGQNFPWLMSNFYLDGAKTEVIGSPQTKPYHILDHRGIRVGVIGCADKSWMTTLGAKVKKMAARSNGKYELTHEPIENLLPGYIRELKDQKCKIIVLLSHSRLENDTRVANSEAAQGVDIILTGHDHDLNISCVNGIPIVNTGVDFGWVSLIEMWKNTETPASLTPDNSTSILNDTEKGAEEVMVYKGKRYTFQVVKRRIVSEDAKDEHIQTIVDEHVADHKDKFPEYYQQIAWIPKDNGEQLSYDGQFTNFRHKESQIGNFFTDAMRNYCNTDFAFVGTGQLRSETMFPDEHAAEDEEKNDAVKGYKLTLGDLKSMSPWTDTTTVMELNSKMIYEMLNHSMSKWPAQDGRFLQVSGLSFVFNPKVRDGKYVPGGKVERVYKLDPDNKPTHLLQSNDDKTMWKLAVNGFLGNRGGDKVEDKGDARPFLDALKGGSCNMDKRREWSFVAADLHDDAKNALTYPGERIVPHSKLEVASSGDEYGTIVVGKKLLIAVELPKMLDLACAAIVGSEEKETEYSIEDKSETSSVSAMSLKSASDDGSTPEVTEEFNDWRLPSLGRMLMRTNRGVAKLDPSNLCPLTVAKHAWRPYTPKAPTYASVISKAEERRKASAMKAAREYKAKTGRKYGISEFASFDMAHY